jgi:hypothetical protein
VKFTENWDESQPEFGNSVGMGIQFNSIQFNSIQLNISLLSFLVQVKRWNFPSAEGSST